MRGRRQIRVAGGSALVPSTTRAWSDVFDIAAAKGTSIRLPYCDTVLKGVHKARCAHLENATGVPRDRGVHKSPESLL